MQHKAIEIDDKKDVFLCKHYTGTKRTSRNIATLQKPNIYVRTSKIDQYDVRGKLCLLGEMYRPRG